jgi:hypothetical protein
MTRRGSVPRRLATLLSLAAVACACSATPSASPAASGAAQTTQWETVLQGIGADGSVDVETAAAAFSLAVAPLPGVTLPDGPKPTANEIIDGSGPARWLRRDWDQLTPDQQTAAQGMLKDLGDPYAGVAGTPPANEVASIGRDQLPRPPALGADPTPAATGAQCGIWLYNQEDAIATVPAAVRPFAEDLNVAAVAFAKHLGRDPVAKWGACLEPPGKITAGTLVIVYDAKGEQSGEPDHCIVELNSDYFKDLKALDAGRYGFSISMAAFNCFLATAAYYGPSVRAPYVEQGLTAWASATVSQEVLGGPGTAVAGAWDDYLEGPTISLYQRTWDAIGFYAQLNEIETMWQFVDPMLRADGAENAFYVSGARDPKFAARWAAGYFRDSSYGPDWDILGPGATPAKSPPADIGVANGQETDVAADALTVSISNAISTADVTYITGTDLRIADGSLDNVIHSDELETTKKAYCTKDGGDCKCPPDSLGAKLPTPPELKSPFRVALTGMLDGGAGALTGVSLQDYCQSGPTPAPDTPKGGAKPCGPNATGCAGSIGDTHLRTIDLQQFDLQAAGEYVLLRSADSSIELQAREVPFAGISDTSINVAFAWKVAGHHVTMYSRGASYEVRLDGKSLDPAATGTLDLGQGASLTPLGQGLEVAFPDGTISTVVFHGNGIDGALDLEVAPSATIKQGTVGLLGPIAKGSELPALPDGTALPLSTDRATRYQQRYQRLAPAWHVTPATSLFEYDAGQSSTSFDKPGFPSPDVAFDVKELEARIGAQAEQEALGICNQVQADQGLYDACVYDVIATADPTFGQFYEEVRDFLADGPTALDVCNPPAAPGGFSVVPCIQAVTGAAVTSDGTLALGILPGTRNAQPEVDAVDPATGHVLRRSLVGSNPAVAIVGGSLWIGTTDFLGDVGTNCVLRRLDPTAYKEQARISVPCGSEDGAFVATAAGIWVVDGSSLRPVDLASNTLGVGVPLPVAGAKLLGTDSVVYAGTPNESPGTWYRLGPGDGAFSQVGARPAGGGLDPVPGGGALWLQDFDGTVKQFTSSATPTGATLAVTGTLVAADDHAVYAARDDQTAGHFELWRYPMDGSAATKVAENNLAFPITDGNFYMQYSGSGARIISAPGKVYVVWQVPAGIGLIGSVFIQVAPVP